MNGAGARGMSQFKPLYDLAQTDGPNEVSNFDMRSALTCV